MQSYKTQRTRSFRPRTLSVISVPLCFKSFLAEKMKGLPRELATQFHESEKLQSAIRYKPISVSKNSVADSTSMLGL